MHPLPDLQLKWLTALSDEDLADGAQQIVRGFDADGTLDEEVAAMTLAELASRLERRTFVDAREQVLGLRQRASA